MLSPDPYVQVPEYSQNFNRYSYVLNNPLNLTDPTGFNWFGKACSWLKTNWRTVVVMIVVAIVTWGVGAYLVAGGYAVGGSAFATLSINSAGLLTSSLTATGMATVGAIAGAVGGGLNAALSGGNLGDVLRGATVGAVQGAITAGVLSGLEQAPGVFNAKTLLHVAGHGVVGGSANAAMGGKFQDGFISAAASAGFADAGAFSGISGTGPAAVAGRTIGAGVVGGTVSVIGGGKFANGAYTAAFQHLLNYEVINIYKGFVPTDPYEPQSSELFPSYKKGMSYDNKNDLTTHSYETLPCTDLPIQDVSGDVFTIASFFLGGGGMRSLQAGTKRAFWSGIGAKSAAQEAGALGLKTLESTLSARILIATQRVLPRSFVDKAWMNLSHNWAATSNGPVHFFGPLGEGAMRVGSVWQTVELKVLQSQGARIIYHYK
jgi:hypothetical protein